MGEEQFFIKTATKLESALTLIETLVLEVHINELRLLKAVLEKQGYRRDWLKIEGFVK